MTKFWGIVLVWLFCCASSEVFAQSVPVVFDCVQQPPLGGCANSIRTNSTALVPGNYVTAAGYFAPGDLAGGLFSVGGNGSCATVTPAPTSMIAVSPGDTLILISSTAGISAGMSVISATGGVVLPYDVITSVSSGPPAITLETPVVQSAGMGVTLTIGSDNGGSVIRDAEPTPRCFYRQSWQFNAREWGARQDGDVTPTDYDTIAVQSWLNSNQPFMTNISAHQPHIAIPGTSIVQVPIVCPAGTTIQGSANVDHSSSFTIQAPNTGLTFGSEVVDANYHCRFSGIGIDGNHVATSLNVIGTRVTVDGFSTLQHGNPYNLYCGSTQVSGLLVKDIQITGASSDNIYMPLMCANVRLVGDIITQAGGRGVFLGGSDLTVADGVIEQSQGVGLDLESAYLVSVTGMYFGQNGKLLSGPGTHSAIQIGGTSGGASYISICGNHFYENGYGNNATSAHITFGNNSTNTNLCGNAYRADSTVGPAYVYDVLTGTTLQNVGMYESWQPQAVGVSTAAAAALLPQFQVVPEPRSYLTGLVLSNDLTAPIDTVDIAPGTATDSTGVATIPNPAGCNVSLSHNGLNGLDAGTMAINTTYFFFVVEDLGPAVGTGTTPSCIASTSLAPNLTVVYGHGIYRLVGALFTDNSSPSPNVVQFHQNGDTFYLANSVTDIKTSSPSICSAGATAVSCPLSVPCGRTASATACPSPGFVTEAFGRIVGGGTGLAASQLLLSSLSQSDQAPTTFPTAPGYTNGSGPTISGTSAPAFPFHLYTDGGGNVRTRASAASTNAYEITDGWVWHRQQ